MPREQERLRARQDIGEALSLGAVPGAPQPPPAPLPPALAPHPAPLPGALNATPGAPPQAPHASPYQVLPSFKSPPVAAALQGPEGMAGHPALTKPVGFARGGYVVRIDR